MFSESFEIIEKRNESKSQMVDLYMLLARLKRSMEQRKASQEIYIKGLEFCEKVFFSFLSFYLFFFFFSFSLFTVTFFFFSSFYVIKKFGNSNRFMGSNTLEQQGIELNTDSFWQIWENCTKRSINCHLPSKL